MNYLPEHEEKWLQLNEAFRKDMAPTSYDMWIAPMKLFRVTPTEVIAYFTNTFNFEFAKRRYVSRVDAVVKTIFGLQYNFRLIKEEEAVIDPKQETGLNTKYTFNNFISGASNSFAYAAALSVAEEPAVDYNPLFIYGDVGLGKTHLMNAIGNFILEQNPTANIMLTTSERFTNELIETIVKKRGGPEFRAKLRNLDVLMVDDVQFFGKTSATQEEFFHTFNELYNAGKQIVLSSDRPPQELPAIEDRLRSRFASGLIVDIRRPDFETRVAILQRKCEEELIDISYEALEYIAAHFDRSIRELQGALTRVQAVARLEGIADIDLDLTVRALENLATSGDSRNVTPKSIIEATARKFGITPADIMGKKRSREIAVPRQVAIFLCRELTELSTTNIGKEFGDRDHTTVMHSCEKITAAIPTDTDLARKIAELRAQIKGA